MRRLTSIVAVNPSGVIGCRNSLPWRLKSDLAFFKSVTSSNVVLMGRMTFDSLGRCLPNRYNVILSKQFNLFADTENCVLRAGIAEGLAAIERAPASYRDAFVIGGATIYRQFHQIVDRYLITVVDKNVDGGDAFFDIDVLDQKDDWSVSRVLAKSKGEGDDSSYEIFELTAKNSIERHAKRSEILADAGGANFKIAQRRPRLRKSQLESFRSPAFDGI